MKNIQERIMILSEEKRFLLKKILGENNPIFLNLKPTYPRSGSYSTSESQKRMWMQWEKLSMGDASNIVIPLRLKGDCKLNILENSIRQVIKRHESLRTCFKYKGSELIQEVSQGLDFFLNMDNLGKLSRTEYQLAIEKILEYEQETPFDMTVAPLMRSKIYKKNESEFVLIFVFHHAIFDGWSINLFMQEVVSFYNADVFGEKLELPTVNFQQGDFCSWEKQLLLSDKYKDALNEISKYLQDHLCVTDAAFKLNAISENSFKNAYVNLKIEKGTTEKLKKICSKNKVTLYVLLLTIYSITLSKLLSRSSFLIGSPIAGRYRGEFENTIGMFVNTIPIKIEVDGSSYFHDQLKKNQDTTTFAYEFQKWPFDKIKEDLQIPETDSPFKILFALQNTINQQALMKDVKISVFRKKKQPFVARILKFYSPLPNYFAISLAMSERTTGILGTLEYNPLVFSKNFILEFGRKFKEIIESIINQPDGKIQDI